MNLRFRRYPLHIYLSVLFVTLIVIFVGVSIVVSDQAAKRMMLGTARTHFGQIENDIRQGIQRRNDATITITDLLAATTLTDVKTLRERLDRLAILAQPLRGRGAISAVYVGYADGDFILARRLVRGSDLVRSLRPPANAVFLVQSLATGPTGEREGRYLFFDDALRQLEDRLVPGYAYDPRERPWYREAMDSNTAIVTDPYPFFTTGEAGITVARRSASRQAVAAVDVTMGLLSEQLDRVRPTPSSALIVLDDKGEVIADADGSPPLAAAGTGVLKLRNVSELGQPVLAELFAARPATGNRILEIDRDGETWQGLVSTIALPGLTLYVAVATPQSELLADARRLRNQSLATALVLLLLGILCAVLVSRLAARALVRLTKEAAEIRALKFDQPVSVRSFIAEIDALAVTMGEMKETIRRFLEIAASLGGERRFDRLLDRILTEAIGIASARGGLIYLVGRDGALRCELAKWEDQVVAVADHVIEPEQRAHPAIRAMREGSEAVVVPPAEFAALFPVIRDRDELSVLSVPLKNRQGAHLGVLILLQDPAALARADEQDVVALVEAVSGTAAVALDAQRLILEQKRLLEALIELVADAIDRKSPYTGGHCQRVPELTKMIARAAEAAKDGPFADFALDETQWEELHIAAWLHDCGKVTSPEFVVDKATKLETIYDRLHEVRMRFEVIKREAEVACWRAIADGAERETRLAALRELWAELDDEFAFVAGCNQGGEFMAPEKIERLQRVARRRWTRTLDDRIGLSEDEQRRKAETPALPLPAQEPLLADRPEHIFPRRDADRLPPDNAWGFKIDVPEHLYNRGELHNLSIGRGTLTAEDRYKINEHMVETIRMLSRLPFPSHLKNVVEIAGGHHEKMDGTGYPRRLSRDEMSVPARMMAIADIFEALTAADRPYKKAKTLSESLTIMSYMRNDRHIDPDLFELFLRSAVYREFADRYLSPAQIDEVDIEKFIRAPSREPVGARA